MTEQRLLSRIAESLHWIGRYFERADGTARIINAYIHRIAEDPFGDPENACRSLFAILGVELDPDKAATTEVVLEDLVFSHESPSAITGALRSAYENARRSREVISSEMWVCINGTHDEVAARQRQARRVGAASYFKFVSDRAALFAGLSDATISHDEGWRFLVLGRSIERIDMTCRLLDAQLVGLDTPPRLAHAPARCGGDGVVPEGVARQRQRRVAGLVPAPGPPVPSISVPRVERGGQLARPADDVAQPSGRHFECPANDRSGPQPVGVLRLTRPG